MLLWWISNPGNPQGDIPMKLLDHYATVLSYQRTGSSYTCNPPVLDTDEDWVILQVPGMYDTLRDHLSSAGFYRPNRQYFHGGGTHFTTWRNVDHTDKRNLIITENPEWYALFVEATEIAKEENLLKKEDRVALFELIMRKYRKGEDRSEKIITLEDLMKAKDYLKTMDIPTTIPWVPNNKRVFTPRVWSAKIAEEFKHSLRT